MAAFHVTHAARADIVSILAWSHEHFGQTGRTRYEALIVAAIRDAASRGDHPGFKPRPELGQGIFTWHLFYSRGRSFEPPVRRPRHFLVCRREASTLVIGRILHDAMDLSQYVDIGEDLPPEP